MVHRVEQAASLWGNLKPLTLQQQEAIALKQAELQNEMASRFPEPIHETVVESSISQPSQPIDNNRNFFFFTNVFVCLLSVAALVTSFFLTGREWTRTNKMVVLGLAMLAFLLSMIVGVVNQSYKLLAVCAFLGIASIVMFFLIEYDVIHVEKQYMYAYQMACMGGILATICAMVVYTAYGEYKRKSLEYSINSTTFEG